MPSKLPVVTVLFTDDLLERLDDFQFENRIRTRSDAIRQLVEEGLKRYETKKISKHEKQ